MKITITEKQLSSLNEQLDVGKQGMEIDQKPKPSPSAPSAAPPPTPGFEIVSCDCVNVDLNGICPPTNVSFGANIGFQNAYFTNNNIPTPGDHFVCTGCWNSTVQYQVHSVTPSNTQGSLSLTQQSGISCGPAPCDPNNFINAFPAGFIPQNLSGYCRACGLLNTNPLNNSIYTQGTGYQPNDPSPNPNFATLDDVCNFIDTNSCC